MITLSNGVVLNKGKMYEADTGGDSITKAIARKVFNGKTEEVTTLCTTCSTPHGNTYAVGRRADGSVSSIGCKEFTEDDIKLIKRWLKR